MIDRPRLALIRADTVAHTLLLEDALSIIVSGSCVDIGRIGATQSMAIMEVE